MENSEANERGASAVGVIRLMIKLIVSQRKLILGFALASGVIAVAYVLTAPRSWPGSAIVEIGRFKQPPVYLTGGDLIESPSQITGVFQALEFKRRIIEKAEPLLAPSSSRFRHLLISLSVEPVDNTGLIKIIFAGESPEQTRTVLQHAVDAILARHQELIAQRDANFKRYGANIDRELAATEQLLARSEPEDGGPLSSRVADTVARSQESMLISGSIVSLRRERLTVQNYLNSHVSPTRLVSEIWIGDRPLGIGGMLIATLAILGGALAGIVIALLAVPSVHRQRDLQDDLYADSKARNHA